MDDEDPVFETLTGSNGGGFEFSLDVSRKRKSSAGSHDDEKKRRNEKAD